jgi:hypothetical protein
MRDKLIQKMHDFLLRNYPEIMVPLQQKGEVTKYLTERIDSFGDLPEVLLQEGKPIHIVEEICLKALEQELGPSKFNYLVSVLLEEFEKEYYRWLGSGILTFEVINLIEDCTPYFEALAFGEGNDDNKRLRYAIIGTIQEYLINKQ